MAEATDHQPGLICAGLYGSASTWAFNVAASVLRARDASGVIQFYADMLDDQTMQAIRCAACFVIKTHSPGKELQALSRTPGHPVIITVRDPRDAVTSMMSRFGRDFATASSEVTRSAASILSLRRQCIPLILRYENRFVGRRGVEAIAQHLGVTLSSSQCQSIVGRLSAKSVIRRIEQLLAQGILRGENPAMEWEEGTQWHPRHVGDGRVGKYQGALSNAQVQEIADLTEPFCSAFGYAGC